MVVGALLMIKFHICLAKSLKNLCITFLDATVFDLSFWDELDRVSLPKLLAIDLCL